MARYRFRIVSILAAVALTAAAATPVSAFSWDHQYEGNVTPNAATPGWNDNSSGLWSSDGDLLTGNTTLGATGWYDLGPSASSWDASTPSTVELRMLLESTHTTADYGVQFSLGNTTGYWQVQFSDSGVQINGGALFSIDTSEFHTYLLSLSGNTLNVYIDGGASPSLTATAGGPLNKLYLGDLNGSDTGGKSVWDYVYWTNDGAFTPQDIPEPAALALVAAGLPLAFGRRRAVN